MNLPVELLDSIIRIAQLEEESISVLFRCSLVSRLWCKVTVRHLWKNAVDYAADLTWTSATLSPVSTLYCLLPQDVKGRIQAESSHPDTLKNVPMFDYASFIHVLRTDSLRRAINRSFPAAHPDIAYNITSLILGKNGVVEVCVLGDFRLMANTFLIRQIDAIRRLTIDCGGETITWLDALTVHRVVVNELCIKRFQHSHDGIAYFVENQTELRHLTVENGDIDPIWWDGEGHRLLQAIISIAPRLTYLCIETPWVLELNVLPVCSHLRGLSIGLSDERMTPNIDPFNLEYLEELSVFVTMHDMQICRALIEWSPNLKHLSMWAADERTNCTDVLLAVSQFASRLRTLRIWMEIPPKEVLQKLFQNCCCLRTIEILRDVNEEFVLQIFMTKTLTCRRRDNYCEISLIS